MSGEVVSNTGPLISLEMVSGGYDLMRRLYERIIVPRSVLAELAPPDFASPQAYLSHFEIEDLVDVRDPSDPRPFAESRRLHDAEREAIELAIELELPLLIEETLGRRVAQSLGLHISGIAGQVVRAAREGIIAQTEASCHLNELLHAGRINRKIHQALLPLLRPPQ